MFWCFGDNRWDMRFNLMLCAKAYPKELMGMIEKSFYGLRLENRIGIAWLKAVTVGNGIDLGNIK